MVSWLSEKLQLPTREERSELLNEWDRDQVDDWPIANSDPEYDRVVQAAQRLEAAPEEAFQTLLALAQLGSVSAMSWTAYCYQSGVGTATDNALAFDWYKKGAKGGSQWALLCYAHCLWKREDFSEFEEAFRPAAEAGWAPAQYWLACTRIKIARTRTSMRLARPLLESAIVKGSPAAKRMLGYYMARGWYRLRDIPAGFRMLDEFARDTREIIEAMRAAESGDAYCQYRLGWLYAFGGRLAHSDKKAMAAFELAAAQGYPNAMLAKGWMFGNGRGVPYDPFEAHVWAATAAHVLPEDDIESCLMAAEYRDFYRPLLSKAERAKARRHIQKNLLNLAQTSSAT